jgi:hypothetical protein
VRNQLHAVPDRSERDLHVHERHLRIHLQLERSPLQRRMRREHEHARVRHLVVHAVPRSCECGRDL